MHRNNIVFISIILFVIILLLYEYEFSYSGTKELREQFTLSIRSVASLSWNVVWTALNHLHQSTFKHFILFLIEFLE